MKLPAFESLDEKMEIATELHYKTTSHVPTVWAVTNFKSGFNAGVIERDKQWQSKVSKLIEALSWYARHNIKVTKTECGTGEMHPLAESALAEFYGDGKND